MPGNKMNCFFKRFTYCMIVLLFCFFGGCASPHLSEYYGRSYEAMLYAQAVNPDAPADRSPVDECPGVVAEGIYEKYLDTFGGKSFAEQLGEMMLER
jgi:hypothetical protein